MEWTRETFDLPRAIAPDVEIVAIGDIHGRADLLAALLDEAASTPAEAGERKLLFTGDLIDRGPDSLGALELAAEAGGRIGASETIALMGNHEILMRMSLDPALPPRLALPALQVWLANGGDCVVEEMLGDIDAWDDPLELLSVLRETRIDSVDGWLVGLRPSYVSGGVLFVHAGVNPAFALDAFLAIPWDTPLARLQEAEHWAWVRGPFLDHKPGADGFSDSFVVHGHTPLDRGHTRGHGEQVARFRLNLDGGSAMTGQAKMAILRGDRAEIVTARSG